MIKQLFVFQAFSALQTFVVRKQRLVYNLNTQKWPVEISLVRHTRTLLDAKICQALKFEGRVLTRSGGISPICKKAGTAVPFQYQPSKQSKSVIKAQLLFARFEYRNEISF